MPYLFTIVFLIITVIGAKLAYWYGKNTKQFLWREYWAMLAWPILGTIALSYFFGWGPIKMFFLGMIILPTLEWFTGLTYHRVMGSRLWNYERHKLPGGYTNYLTLPIWGAGMVLLWLIAHHL